VGPAGISGIAALRLTVFGRPACGLQSGWCVRTLLQYNVNVTVKNIRSRRWKFWVQPMNLLSVATANSLEAGLGSLAEVGSG
jgi:hypothetical protein